MITSIDTILTKASIFNTKHGIEFVTDLVKKANIKSGDKVAVAFWCSPKIRNIVKSICSDCIVYYIEEFTLKNIYGNIENSYYVDLEKSWENIKVKFDKVIMNPPYLKNLHLKVLEEVIKHMNSESDWEIINLSPIRWLEDPLAYIEKSKGRQSDYIKFENSVSKYIKSIDKYTANEMANIFNNRLNVKLGLYTLTKTGGYNYYCGNDLLDKIISKLPDSLDNHVITDKPMKYSIVVPMIVGGAGGGAEKFEATGQWLREKDRVYFNNNKNIKGQTKKK